MRSMYRSLIFLVFLVLLLKIISGKFVADCFGDNSIMMSRIAVNSGQPVGYFYNTQTSEKFIPLGANYIRLDWINNTPYHTTFNASLYDALAAETALTQMAQHGYNIVRVFLDHGDEAHQAREQYGMAGPFETDTAKLYKPCVDNFIDFLRRAGSHNIYVIPVCEYCPYNNFYDTLAKNNVPENVQSINGIYLAQSCLEAKGLYITKLVKAVRDAEPDGALLPTVFSWELVNEVSVTTRFKPFSLSCGKVTTADGKTYDMADPNQRQQCMDNNIINWANQMVAAINLVDSKAMVSASVFTYKIVGKPGPNGVLPRNHPRDLRFPARPLLLFNHSKLSYVDVHTYPLGEDYSLDASLDSSEYPKWDRTAKPLLMGEFGAFKMQFNTVEKAAKAMAAHRQRAFDLGFSGALYWTWDTFSQKELWHLLDEEGAINKALKTVQ